MGDTLDIKSHSKPTAGAVSQFLGPQAIDPSLNNCTSRRLASPTGVCGPATSTIPTSIRHIVWGWSHPLSLSCQFPQEKLSQFPSSKGTERPGWALGMRRPRPLWPPSDSAPTSFVSREAAPLHVPGPTAPATRPGADLVAHGFLVLLVGGFQGGSGRANADRSS